MLFSNIFRKLALSSTYCRQYALHCYIKRCYCGIPATEVVKNLETKTEMGRRTKAIKRKAAVTKEAQDILLDFFNNCDHVTLNKLISFKKKKFQYYSFQQVNTEAFTEIRYLDFEDFLQKTGITYDRIEDMAYSVTQFEKNETSSMSMKFLYPKFDRRNIGDIDKVVVLDVFHNDFAWCVKNTEDDYITDIGFQRIELKDINDHVERHKQIRMFLQTIPESEVYLLRTDPVQGSQVSKKASKYAIQQAVLESMIVTLLNERHLPEEMKFDKSSRFFNKVHIFQPLALKEFYNVTFEKELLPVSDVFKNWFDENHPNIRNWGLNDEERRILFFSRGKGQVSVCALMSDVFCRSLRKGQKQFPRAYT